MAQRTPIERLELHETGNEPEFVVSRIAKIEKVGRSSVRIYMASQRGGYLRLEYTVVVDLDDLSMMARAALHIAADQHNLQIWIAEFDGGH